LIWADSTGVDWIAYGQGNRFMQTGNVSQVKFYAQNVQYVTEFKIRIWTETATDGVFNQKSVTANFAASLVNGLNVINLSIAVSEGDYYGVFIKTNDSTHRSILGVYPSSYDYQASYRASYGAQNQPTNCAWSAAPSSNGTLNLEFDMESPYIILSGDSIISGDPYSTACTNQGNWSAADDYSKSIPGKLKSLTGCTYQNVGVTRFSTCISPPRRRVAASGWR
jgi:hypothetical protein